MKKRNNKAWVVSVDMGYGHQRAAYPLKDIAYERIITANSDKIVTKKESKMWNRFRNFYEAVSRFRSLPLIGPIIWNLFDRYQSIQSFYPFRDLSVPTFGSIYLNRLIKKGFIESVIEYTNKKKLPIISTFFATSLAAAHRNIKDNYCIVTDTDINRIWVPPEPKKVKLYYCTPTNRATKRLLAYGIPKNNIFFTGFPLPKENTGKDMIILKKDLRKRIVNLDPNKIYISRYQETIKKHLNKKISNNISRPLTIMYAVGGAGAQKEIAKDILESLSKKIKKDKIRIVLVAGTRPDIEQYFKEIIDKLNLNACIGKSIKIIFALKKKDHFRLFNKALHDIDILWTKPSELSFYTALGIPIIISPPLGSHEIINSEWLIRMGTGFPQEDPRYVNEWLFEWLDKGILAEAAFEGYLEAPKYGTYNIEELILSKHKNNIRFRY